MKRLALAISLITSAALLSGCIIVPHRHGHRGHHHYARVQSHDGGHHHHHRDHPGGRYGHGGYGPGR